MKCPNCKKELRLESYVYNNVDSYGQRARGTTLCCGTIVVLAPVRKYSVSKYLGPETEDEWGMPATNLKEKSHE